MCICFENIKTFFVVIFSDIWPKNERLSFVLRNFLRREMNLASSFSRFSDDSWPERSSRKWSVARLQLSTSRNRGGLTWRGKSSWLQCRRSSRFKLLSGCNRLPKSIRLQGDLPFSCKLTGEAAPLRNPIRKPKKLWSYCNLMLAGILLSFYQLHKINYFTNVKFQFGNPKCSF